MVLRTVLSVLEQDYPADRMVLVVSDDAHNPDLERALEGLGVIYHEPPPRDAPGRDGAPKSGNLNSALALLERRFANVSYIETRDADDEAGSAMFLRQVVGQLEHDPQLAFVQTVKETQVSAGDPFCNLDGQFYRRQMLSRNATNSAFPCGSGVVWRLEALEHIGGFPTWNLVEDLQSGVEALRRGWRGCYLTIVGAVGQHSPEDIANVYKQRGTWAIDTVRLMTWGRLRGLRPRQRMQFLEMLLFYLHAFTVPVYVACTALAFVNLLPLAASPLSCVEHLMPFALAAEARLLLLNQPFADRRRRQRHPLRAVWRVKVMWIGLAPVYMIACLKALLGGPGRKPLYRVTRKDTRVRWYWRETVPQAVLSLCLPVALATGVVAERLPSPLILVTAGYWGLINGAALFGFVIRGWFGTSPTAGLRATERRHAIEAESAAAPSPAAVDALGDAVPAGRVG
jgi:cellulose synthase (UDP-forming)